MKEIEDINIGYKLQHLIPAFFIMVAGTLLFFLHFIPAILLILIGIALLCMRAGIEIDIKNKQIRKYSALSNLKFGTWDDLSEYIHVEIKFTNKSQTMSSRGSSTTVRTKTYDLVFFRANGTEFEFNDFTDYKIASSVFRIVVNAFKLTSRNVIEEIRNKASQRERR